MAGWQNTSAGSEEGHIFGENGNKSVLFTNTTKIASPGGFPMQILVRLFLVFLFALGAVTLSATSSDQRRSFRGGDGTSIDAIVTALYASVSGEAGAKRDWARMRDLFVRDARLMPVIWRGEEKSELRQVTVEEYIAFATTFFQSNSFHEREIGRQVHRFGNMAQVFSTYESYHSQLDPVPFTRGINSIQLFYDGSRWWIVSVLWDEERDGMPIPGEYLVMPG